MKKNFNYIHLVFETSGNASKPIHSFQTHKDSLRHDSEDFIGRVECRVTAHTDISAAMLVSEMSFQYRGNLDSDKDHRKV